MANNMEAPMGQGGHKTARYDNVLELHPRNDEGVLLDRDRVPTNLVQGSVVAGRDVVTWTLEIPLDPTYPGLATFVPGYLGIKQSSRKPRNALAQEGIATLSYSPSRRDDESLFSCFRDPQALHVKTLGKIAADLRQRGPEIKKDVPGASQIDFDRKMLILHSMGGLAGPRYALSETSAVESIVGYATVGFGHPILEELAVDFPKGVAGSIKHELAPALKSGAIEINMRNLRDFIKYYTRLRVIFEGLSCLRDHVIEEVDDLRDAGVPYHFLGFGRDILVRPDQQISQFVTSYSTLESYGHLAPQVKSAKVAHKVAELALAA